MEEALFLSRFASTVFVVHRRRQFRASSIMLARVEKHEKLKILTPYAVEEILGREQVEGARLRHLESQEQSVCEAAGVFVAIGHKPNTELFVSQLDLNAAGYITTKGKSTYTSVEGVFACGDVQDPTYRQAVTAAGSGCQAAIDAERWLEAQSA